MGPPVVVLLGLAVGIGGYLVSLNLQKWSDLDSRTEAARGFPLQQGTTPTSRATTHFLSGPISLPS